MNNQRKGQWMINYLKNDDFPYLNLKKLGIEKYLDAQNKIIEQRMWNMENNQFDMIMGKYDE